MAAEVEHVRVVLPGPIPPGKMVKFSSRLGYEISLDWISLDESVKQDIPLDQADVLFIPSQHTAPNPSVWEVEEAELLVEKELCDFMGHVLDMLGGVDR